MSDTPKALRRVPEGAWLGGVSTGLGQHFNLDATLVRIGWIVLALLGFAGVPIYLVLWSVIPDIHEHRTWLPLGAMVLLFGLPFCCWLVFAPLALLGGN